MNADTIILLPAHNEAARVGGVIAGVRKVSDEAAVVVVDDGSTDATGDCARAAGATVLRLPFNLGYGVALQTGYKYAVEQGCEYLVQLDGDGQHDPAGIPELIERVRSGRCDICVGSRFLEGDTYSIPWSRRIGMILFRRVGSMCVGHTITDPTSGFQAMNRKVFTFFSRDLYPGDYPDTDVLVLLHRHGFEIAEAPVVMSAGDSGQSIHRGLRPLFYLYKMALAIPLNLLRKE